MTESKWLTTRDPTAMLRYLRDSASDRKFRLFACADLRWSYRDAKAPIIRDVRAALRLAEQWADAGTCPRVRPENALNWIVMSATGLKAAATAIRESSGKGYFPCPEQRKHQAHLLRDLFGNPFRPAVRPSWLAPTVTELAWAAYDERPSFEGTFDPTRLAILADALEDAGCADALISHLRSAGPHVRGCWALDVVLGKS
jgi:hypothetical protein